MAPADRRSAILDAAIVVIARDGVRGLRVEHVAAQAGVAVSLIYYYFANRTGLVRATLDYANERGAARSRDAAQLDGREALTRILLAELDSGRSVRETSLVWGEVLASAAFVPELREQLRAANETWVELVAALLVRGQQDGSIGAGEDARACAERLTALIDGLSSRWLAGLVTRKRARELMQGAIEAELSMSHAGGMCR